MINCSVEGCEKESHRVGMCSIHYRRNLRHGNPLILKKKPNGDGFIAFGYSAKQINGVKKFDHVRVVENVLGFELPKGVVIHHWNEIKTDNRNENLLVCQDRAYHNLIHARMRAYDACGNASFRPCVVCKKYDDVKNMKNKGHSECLSKRTREIYASKTIEEKKLLVEEAKNRRNLKKYLNKENKSC